MKSNRKTHFVLMFSILSLFFVNAMQGSVSVLAEEKFTLHNGTQFRMTKEEVINIEKQNGCILTEDSISYNYPEGAISGIETIENQPDTTIVYGFKDNSMYFMGYTFCDTDTYEMIEYELIQKYGETDYSSVTGLEFPQYNELTKGRRIPFASWDNTVIFDEPSILDSFDITNPIYVYQCYNRTDYSHRLVYLSNDEAVFIEHYNYELITNGKLGASKQYLKYHLLTADELNTIQQEINQP